MNVPLSVICLILSGYRVQECADFIEGSPLAFLLAGCFSAGCGTAGGHGIVGWEIF